MPNPEGPWTKEDREQEVKDRLLAVERGARDRYVDGEYEARGEAMAAHAARCEVASEQAKRRATFAESRLSVAAARVADLEGGLRRALDLIDPTVVGRVTKARLRNLLGEQRSQAEWVVEQERHHGMGIAFDIPDPEARCPGCAQTVPANVRDFILAADNATEQARDGAVAALEAERARAEAADSQLRAVREWAENAEPLPEDATDTEKMRDPYGDAAREILALLDSDPSGGER